MIENESIYKNDTGELLIKKLSTLGQEYYFKEQDNMNYVFYDNTLYVHSKNKNFLKGLYLFRLVKNDFDKWLKINKEVSFIEKFRPFFKNENIKIKEGQEKYSYDINHAYWRVAFINGYISEKTYEHGLKLKQKNDEFKQLYCMALSSQGRSKTLEGYVGKENNGKKIVIEKNIQHRFIYDDIRNKTYSIMDEIAFILKDDFVEYNIDCITFLGIENKKIVENFFESKNLTFKQI